MADQLKTSIVRIQAADGSVVGAGFLATDRHILTCAHVVSRSLGLPDTPADPPLAEVQLDFPLLAPGRIQTARVVYWQPPRSDDRGDVAGLELDGDPPINANPMPLVITNEVRLHPFNVLSSPQLTADHSIYDIGLDRLQSRIAKNSDHYSDFLVYQQRLSENLGQSRQHGDTETRRAERSQIIERLNDLARSALGISFNQLFGLLDHTTSGAPIWDERLNGVVAMAVAADQPAGRKAISTIPAEILHIAKLIIEQERKKGIIAYVELAAQADEPSPAESNQPRRSVVKDWELDPEFSLLEAAAQPEGRTELPRPSERTKRRLENILEAVNAHPRFVLIGEPGAGKTTTIRRLARDAARDRLNDPEAPLPVFLDLPRWGDEATPAQFVHANGPFGDDPTARLAAGDMLLFLDGLNEMGKEGPRKAKLLREWLNTPHGPKRVIITCRAADYAGDLDLGLPTVLAEELDGPRIRRFVERYLEDSAAPFLEKLLPKDKWEREDVRHLFRLARNPYLLTALILVYRGSPDGNLPRNTGALFKALVRTLWKREEQKQTPGWMPLDEMEIAFAGLAFAMIDQGQPVDVPYHWMVRKLLGRRWWQRTGDGKKIAALLQAGSSANLVEIRGNNVRFYHQLIQEYFAAVALNNTGLRGRVAHPRLGSFGRRAGKWDQVVVALCGIAPHKADAIVREVSAQDLYLAAMCIASGVSVSEATQQKVIASLLANLRGQDPAVNTDAAAALGSIGHPAVSGLLEALRDLDWNVRYDASNALGQTGDATAVPGLLEALRDPDARARYAATNALGQIGDAAGVPGLLEALRDLDWNVRTAAAAALGQIGDVAVPGLLEALRDPDDDVCRAAAKTLGQIGDAAAVPGLLEALRKPDWSVRYDAAEALGQTGDATAVPGLLEALRDPDAGLRYTTTSALGQIGDAAAVPGLLEALRDPDWNVRTAAAAALGQIEEAVALPDLLEALHDSNAGVRYAATLALELIRDAAAVPGLLEALRDPDWNVRYAATSALGQIGDAAGVPDLLEVLRDRDQYVRRAAAEALGQIEDAAAVPGLLEALRDPDRDVREAAARALERIATPEALAAVAEWRRGQRGAD